MDAKASKSALMWEVMIVRFFLLRPGFFTIIIEIFAKRPFLPDFCVPDNRDLSTGSNFNPRNTQCIPVVKIIAFLELEQKYAFFKGLSYII